MCDVKATEDEPFEKEKVAYAQIIVEGTKENPYYEIEYYDLTDNTVHVGYGSYYLDVVFDYLEKYFDVMEKQKSETEIAYNIGYRQGCFAGNEDEEE